MEHIVCKFFNSIGFDIGEYRIETCHRLTKSHRTIVNPLGAIPTKWSNILKQLVDKLPTNCLSVLDHFVKLALKDLRFSEEKIVNI